MLIDNHSSYTILKYDNLANKNHICLYLLISHLIHCMQPLDVGIFQLNKHWYNVAI